MNININAKTIGIFFGLVILIVGVFAGGMYLGSDSSDDEKDWDAPTGVNSQVEDADGEADDAKDVADADVAPEGFEPNLGTEGETAEEQTTDGESAEELTTITPDTSEREAPLMSTPTRILVSSALPSSSSYWNADMSGDPATYVSPNPTYYVLEDAKVRVYQDIPNLGIENYKTESVTSDAGYSGVLDLESNGFSEYKDEAGKMYVIVESEHLASNVGKVGLCTSVPEEKNKIIRVKVIPDTYSFSTVLAKQSPETGGEFLSWLTEGGTDDIKIESIRPCAYSSSWGWNLASIVNAPKVDVYMSTKATGDWKQLSFITTEAVDANNNLHIDLRPQILTAEQGYTGSTKFDMETTGDKVFYVMFDHTYSEDEIYKIGFTVTPSSITVTEITQL